MESSKDVELNIKAEYIKTYNPECPCCLEVPEKGRIIFDCQHLMCTGCFMIHNKKSNNCPICRVVYRENTEQLPRPRPNLHHPVRHPPQFRAPRFRALPPAPPAPHQRRQIRTNREQRLRDAPPLDSNRDPHSEDNEPPTDYKNLAIVVLADIFVMAIWLLKVNMYSK